MSPFVKPPTGKSFRFVRACERARRGEAVWASERRFDCEARAVVRRFYFLSSPLWQNWPAGSDKTDLPALAQLVFCVAISGNFPIHVWPYWESEVEG